MVFGYVKQSRGHIKIYSDVGEGTTVRMYLPTSREDAPESTSSEASPEVGAEAMRIIKGTGDIDLLDNP